MSCFVVNKSNARYEVLKDGDQLFNTNFTQIVLHSGLIVFVRDLLSESLVLTPGTSIMLQAGQSKVTIIADATGVAYEIEAIHGTAARMLFNEILIAAGQKESKITDEASVAVVGTILPPIQQVSNLLANCLEHMTYTFVNSGGGGARGGGEGAGDCGPQQQQPNQIVQRPMDGGRNFDLGGGYQSTYNNGTYSVRFGPNQSDIQEFRLDDQGPGPGPSDYYPPNEEEGPAYRSRGFGKRHGGRGPGFEEAEGFGFGSRGPPQKKSKFHDEYGRQLFVGNLPQTILESELADIFSAYGEIEKIHIITNDTPSTPFIAFILYDFETSAQRALRNKGNIHMKMRDGSERRLNIQDVKPKPWRPPRHD